MFIRLCFVAVLLSELVSLCGAADDLYASLDPKAITITLPKDIKWVDSANGLTSTAALAGDPNKEGYYVILMKWRPARAAAPTPIRMTAS